MIQFGVRTIFLDIMEFVDSMINGIQGMTRQGSVCKKKAHLDSGLGPRDPQDPFRVNPLFLQERQQLEKTKRQRDVPEGVQTPLYFLRLFNAGDMTDMST